jgi:hypothetical protein
MAQESTPAIEPPAPALELGSVVSAVRRIVVRRWNGLILIATVFVIVPHMAVVFLPRAEIVALAVQIPALVFEGSAILIASGEMTGGPVSARRALELTTNRFGALLTYWVLSGIGIALGLLLFALPGLVLASLWIAATPALLIENRSAAGAMDRSQDLSRGSRWQLLAAATVYIVAWAAAYGGVYLLAKGFAGDPLVPWTLYLVVYPLAVAALNCVGAVGAGVIYAQLRTLKEGVHGAQIGITFD